MSSKSRANSLRPVLPERPPVRSLAVMICTRDRVGLLERMMSRLASSIAGLERGQGIRAQVVVVDNAMPGQRAAIEDAARRSGLTVHYVHEPKLGYATVRNCAIEAALALSLGPDLLVFLDDDDLPEPDLLEQHVRVMVEHGADVVSGREDGKPNAGPLAADRRVTRNVATNNVSFRRWLVEEAALRFDTRFDQLGGEDYVFFSAAAERGAVMVASAAPIITRVGGFDEPHAVRMTMARVTGCNRVVIERLTRGRLRALKVTMHLLRAHGRRWLAERTGSNSAAEKAIHAEHMRGAIQGLLTGKGLSRQQGRAGCLVVIDPLSEARRREA